MSCTNCFNGCTETTSDKCVKYTGNSITFLGISTGDTLLAVENAITTYLASVFSGEGIFPVIEPTYICAIVRKYLPCATCGDPTLVEILDAIIQAICEIEAEIAVERARIDVIEADYDVDCLTGVTVSSGTHAVLQAVITALCEAMDDIDTLNDNLALYVKIADLPTYIANYITSTTSTLMSTKMVPYAIYPFYPTTAILEFFSGTGVGQVGSVWENVYYCNGANGTPDLRGRALVGVTAGVGTLALNAEVDPSVSPYSPAYYKDTKVGNNAITLSASQVAAHTHIATTTVTDPGHTTSNSIEFRTSGWGIREAVAPAGAASCYYPVIEINGRGTGISGCAGTNTYPVGETATADPTNITVSVSNAVNTPADGAHLNIQPVYACHYIMYIPA